MLKVNLTDDENSTQDNNSGSEGASKPLENKEEFTFDLNEEDEVIPASDSADTEKIDLTPELSEKADKAPAPAIPTGKPVEEKSSDLKPEPLSPAMEDEKTDFVEKSSLDETEEIEVPPPPVHIPPLAKKDSSSSSDYYEADFDTSSSNKKWIFIGAGVIAVIVIILIFFNPFGSDTANEEVVTPIDPIAQQQEQKRQAEAKFFGEIVEKMNVQLEPVFSFYEQIPANAKLSLLYVYDQDVRLEVFAQNRTPIAELRKNLKTAGLFDQIQFNEVSSLRPNSEVSSNYSFVVTPKSSVPLEGSNFLSVAEVTGRLMNLAGENKVKVKVVPLSGSANRAGDYTENRISINLRGKGSNLIGFLKKLDDEKLNINIAKLSLVGISKNKLNKRDMAGVLELNQYSPN